MTTYAFEKVICPKCGRAYAIPKGSTVAFHCPARKCHEMVNAKAVSVTGKMADLPPKDTAANAHS